MADQEPNLSSGSEGTPASEADSDLLLGDPGTDEGDSDQGQGAPPEEGEFAPLPENATLSERQAHSRMQAAWTKKTTALAAQRREVEATAAQLQARATQLEGMRRLEPYLRDPRTQRFLMETFQEGAEPGTEGGVDGDQDLDPAIVQAIRRHARAVTDPLVERLRNLQEQNADQLALATFVQENPDWQKHHDGMKRAWQKDATLGKPLRSREDALNFAIVEKVRQARQRHAAAEARNRAGVGGAGTASSVPKPTERPMYDMQAAARAALEEAGFRPDEALGRRDLGE